MVAKTKLFLSSILFFLTFYRSYGATSVFSGSRTPKNVDTETLVFRAADYLNEGKIEPALKDLEEVLRIDPNHIDGNQLYGTLLLKLGRDFTKALFHFERALKQPGQKSAAIFGNYLEALRINGRLEDARKFGHESIEKNHVLPTSLAAGSFYLNLGIVERNLGNYQHAYDLFTTAAQVDPKLLNAWLNLGEILLHAESFAEVEKVMTQAIQHHPTSAPLHYLLGTSLHHQKKLYDALKVYLHGETLDPTHLLIQGNIAAAYQGLGRSADAIAYYERVIPQMPYDAGIRNNFGALLGTMNRKDEEVYWLKEALKLDPTLEHPMINLAGHYQDEGLLTLAREYALKAMNYNQRSRLLLKLRYALMLSPISFTYDNMLQERHMIINNIKQILLSPPTEKDELDTTLDRIHFYLSYHGFNDRKIQEMVGNIYHYFIRDINITHPKLLSFPHKQDIHSLLITSPLNQKRKARIGFISKFFGIFEPHGMLLDGVIKYLPRHQFEVVCLFIARTDMKPFSNILLESCDEIHEISLVYQHAVDLITNSVNQLDVLVFADVVSEPINHFLIFNRFAPIQIAFWGNPITSGSNKIDYYISADIMEHPYRTRMYGSDDPYTEQVILLEGQGIWYFQPVDPAIELEKAKISHLVGPIQSFTRSDFNIPENAFVFLLPQSVFKIHPLYDLIIGEIIRKSPSHVHLVVTGGRQARWTRIYLLRLIKAIGGEENLSRLHIIERVSSENFYNLLKICNVILHPFPFDGSRTSADSLIVNIPYITLPTEYLRGRMGFTYYRTMNIPELVASDVEDYINIALQLVNDYDYYQRIVHKIKQNLYLIWEDMYYPYQWTIFFQRLLSTGDNNGIMSYYSFLQQTATTRTSITSDIAKSKQREMNEFAFDENMKRMGKIDRMKQWQLNQRNGVAIMESLLAVNASKWPNLFQFWFDHSLTPIEQDNIKLRMITAEEENKYRDEEFINLPSHYLDRIKKPPKKSSQRQAENEKTVLQRQQPTTIDVREPVESVKKISSNANDDNNSNLFVKPAENKKISVADPKEPAASTAGTKTTHIEAHRSPSMTGDVFTGKNFNTGAGERKGKPIQPEDVRITSTPVIPSPGSISTTFTTADTSTTTASSTVTLPGSSTSVGGAGFSSSGNTVNTAMITPVTSSPPPAFDNLPKFKKIAFDLFSAASRQPGHQGSVVGVGTSVGGAVSESKNTIQIAYSTTTDLKDPSRFITTTASDALASAVNAASALASAVNAASTAPPTSSTGSTNSFDEGATITMKRLEGEGQQQRQYQQRQPQPLVFPDREEIPSHMSDFYQLFRQGKYQEAAEIGNHLLQSRYPKDDIRIKQMKDNYYPLLLLELGLIHYLLGEYETAYSYCLMTQHYINEQTIKISNDIYLESSILYACLGMTSLYREINNYNNIKDIKQRIQYLQTSYELHLTELVEITSPIIHNNKQQQTSSSLSSSNRPKRLHSKVFSLNQASIENSLIQSYHSYYQYDYCLPFLQQYYSFPPINNAEGGYILIFSTVAWESTTSKYYLKQLENTLIAQQRYYYHPNSTIPTYLSRDEQLRNMVIIDDSGSKGGGEGRGSGRGREYRSLLQQIEYYQNKGEHLINSMIKCLQNHPSYQNTLNSIQSQLITIINQINLHPTPPTTTTNTPLTTPNDNDRPGLALITQYYHHSNPLSSIQRDLNHALIKNLQNPFIEEIYLLTEKEILFENQMKSLSSFPNIYKIKQYVIGKRLTFQDAFTFANHQLQNRTVILGMYNIFSYSYNKVILHTFLSLSLFLF